MSKVALHEYLNEIQQLLNEESYGKAVSHCRSILQQYPRHVDTYRLLGQALLEQADYQAAEDVFQRILGALPSDLTAHVGLSIIAQESDNLSKAIWHMQRAYELDPYNPSLQSELKKLYKSRDGRAPAKLVLTQGALAHLHFQGEMYKTAVSEWLSMLEKEPNRFDIKTMLAEAYWRQNERVNAVELSRHLIEEAPNCIQANAIIAEIWLLTGRLNEAQPYLQLLQGLTQISEATFQGETVVGRAFTTKGAPVMFKQILVERGEGDELVVKEETAVSNADWLSEVDMNSDDERGSSEWFTSGAAAATAITAKEPTGTTGWLQDIEADEANDTFDSFADALPADEPPQFDDLFSDEDAQDTDEDNWFNSLTATDADDLETIDDLPENDVEDIFGTSGSASLPDWMDDQEADSGNDGLDWFDGNETAVSSTPLASDDELDWLGELDSSADDDIASDDLFGDSPTQTNNNTEDDDDDDLFSGLGLSGLLVGTATAGVAASMYDDSNEEDGDDSLDWLSDELKPLDTGSYKAAKENADDNDLFLSGTGLTGMLMGADDDSSDDMDSFADEFAEGSPSADLPDWLGDEGANEGGETAVANADIPDWLNQSEDAETIVSAVNLPDWLGDAASDPTDNSSTTADNLPDWLAADDANDNQTESTNDAPLPDWLSASNEDEATISRATIAATHNDNDKDDQDQFADWLSDDLAPLTIEDHDADLSDEEALFGGSGLTAMLLGGEPPNNDRDNADDFANSDDNLSEWLDDDLDDLSYLVNESPANSEPTNNNDLPDWLSSDPIEEDEEEYNDDALQVGLTAGAAARGIAVATHDDNETQEEWEDTTMSNDDENETGLPDELFANMPENEADALDWLDQLAEDQNLDAQDAIPAERDLNPIPAADDNLPDWLQDAPEPAGMIGDMLDFDPPEESKINADTDIPDWLKSSASAIPEEDDSSYASQIAAGEGDIFDEMPTQISAPDPFTNDESSAEFDALFADEDDVSSAEFDALFADEDDDTGDDDVSDLFADTDESDLFPDSDVAETDDFNALFADEDDGASSAEFDALFADEDDDASDDDVSDLFADTDESDLFADSDVAETGDFDALFSDGLDALPEDISDDIELSEAASLGLSGASIIDSLDDEPETDSLDFLKADASDDDFGDLFADLEDVDDSFVDFDVEDTAGDLPAVESIENEELSVDEEVEQGTEEKEKFDPAGALAASALAAALAKRNKKKDVVTPPIEEEDNDDFDDMFADVDSVEDPLADLDMLKKESAVADGMDDSDLDDLFGGMDADDPLDGFGVEKETAVSAVESDPLDFLADGMDDGDLDDLFADADADDDTEEDDESLDIVDTVTALKEEGIDEDLFAEAGMGDSISDSDVMDLSEGLEWLDDSIADTGELTAFDWMEEEEEDAAILAETPTDMAEYDVIDDQISWLDELAAQQEDDLDEELGTPSAASLAGGVAAGAITADLLAGEPEDDDAEIDDAMSWLNDFADEDSEPMEQLPSIADVVDLEPETVDEYKTPFLSDAENALTGGTFDFDDESQSSEDLDSEMARLEALAAEQEEELPTGDAPPLAADATASAIAETTVDIDDVLEDDLDDAMSWLDDLDSQPMIETAVDTTTVDTTEIEETIIAEQPEIEPEPIDLAIADEVETTDDLDDLDDAMTWLDDLEKDDDAVIEEDVASVAAIADKAALTADELSDDDADVADTAVYEEEPVIPARLSRALDWLESLAVTKGVVLTETAVDIDVSDDELAQALDELDALVATPSSGDERDDELWVERSDPELLKEAVIQDEFTHYTAETSEGSVVWKDPNDEDAVDLGVDLDFSDMFDGFDDEDDDLGDLIETAGAKDIDLDLDFDIPDDPDEMMASIGETVQDEFTHYTAETSEGPVIWKDPNDDDAVDLGVDLDFSDMFDGFDDDFDIEEFIADDDGGTDPKVSIPTATESGEELHAQQTDTASSVAPPSFVDLDDGVPTTLPEDPDDAVAWLDGASDEEDENENEFSTFDTSPIDDILGDSDVPAKESDEPLFGEEMGLGHDLSDSMPEWLSFTGGSDDADWLSALPEADVSGWLEAEGEIADSTDSDWAAIDTPRSQPRPSKPAPPHPQPQRNVQTEDLRLPETSMLSSGFSLDGEKLRDARHMVNSGDTQASLTAYRALIQDGDGLNIIISDLEVATQKFNNEPQIRHLLGDAYTQNGQLQKALDTYRDALGMM